MPVPRENGFRDSAARSTQRPTADEFRDIIGRFASGVTVITTTDGTARRGSTASAVSSLSLEPPMLLVCMNRASGTGAAIEASRRFAVNILGEDQPDLAVHFARKGDDKFADIEIIEGQGGQPLIADALATLECSVTESVVAGTHTVFLAEVERATGRTGTPLAYFRGKFGRLTLEQDEAAIRELRARVNQRKTAVDEPLDLEALARELGVPRASVYHALAELSGEGVVVRDGAGAFVVPAVTLQSILDALPALFSIWLGALELTLGALEEERLDDLRRRLDALATPGAPPRPDAAAAALRGFIVETIGVTGSAALQEAWLRVDVATQITSHWAGDDAPDPSELAALHAGFVEIFDAYADGDHAALAHATRRCLDYVDDLFRRALESGDPAPQSAPA